MKKSIKFLGIAALVAAIVFGFAACNDGNNGGGGGGGGGGGNQTPVASDYTFGNMSQWAGDTIIAVSITVKDGKSSGGVSNIQYEGTGGTTYDKSATVPQTVGTYAVTFDVNVATGWNAATGLSAGNLTVTNKTPVASDYTFGNLIQGSGNVTAVTITPRSGKSNGARTIYYEGVNPTDYPKSNIIPTAVGTYAVTFDVAAVNGWNQATGLSAGNLAVVKNWTAGTISTFGSSSIMGVAYGGSAGSGKWVAVGESGRMAYSDNGETWTATTSTFGATDIRCVAYGGAAGSEKWVAVGDSGKMAYSDNGETWTVTDSTFGTTRVSYVAYGGAAGSEKWVAVGYSGKMAYSNNGTTWTAGTGNTFGTTNIMGVAYGGGKWVSGGFSGRMACSDNGETWTAVTNSTFGTTDIRKVAYGGGRWLAVCQGSGKMAYSDDGETWTAVTNSTFTNYILGVAYGGAAGSEKWVAVGDGGSMAYSGNGETWTAVTNTFGTSLIYDTAYGGGKWVAVGQNGRIAYLTDE